MPFYTAMLSTIKKQLKKWHTQLLLFVQQIRQHPTVQQYLASAQKQQQHFKARFPRLYKLLMIILCTVLVFKVLDVVFPLRVDVGYSQTIEDRKGHILHSFLTPDDKWRMYTELPEISTQLAAAIVFKEDKYFYYHLGINPIAVLRAAFLNIFTGRRTSGASTITMQVARMLQPKHRTYYNKILEMFRAMQLEWHYSKAEILQLYFNLVPYGGNIEGIKSASVLFFGKSPEQLSPAEIATLAIIPNRPTSLALGKQNDRTVQERNRWLLRFETGKVFTHAEVVDALLEPLHAQRRDTPRTAPHLANRLKNRYPQQPIIKSYIDYNKQRQIEQIVANFIQRQYTQRIRNAAVVVLNNRTHQIEAYVGSANFFNAEDGGQVDGVRAMRSPGSTLKPYLTALAFDRGLLTPKLKVSDVPTSFSGYSPVNYDKTYNGSVTYEYALAHSLNVPFVLLLEQYGVDEFVQRLSEAGFRQMQRERSTLGLSVILGGCGVSLEELTNLYSVFANKGQFFTAQLSPNDSIGQGTPLMSEAAAYMVTDILDELTRPDLPQSIEASSINLPRIAWKTGTSYGRKDAWSVGYNANYTIGVWTGNFSGEGVQELTGSNIATPLLFEIFNSIDYSPQSNWFTIPRELQRRWVCSETGLPPNEQFCINKQMDVYLPTISPNTICEHQIKVFVSDEEQISYCTACMPTKGYKQKWYPNLPPEIIAYNEREKIPYQKIPPHNPNCERFFESGTPPRIIYPVNNLKYLIDRADNDQLMLSCNAAPDVDKVYWYVNDTFLGETTPNKRLFFVPKIGKNKIACVDDKGRQQIIWIEAEFL